jgi:hypothetical protein
MNRPPRRRLRGLLAPGVCVLMLALPATAAPADLPRDDLPRDGDALVSMIRTAIETSDYGAFERLVLWKDAGEIKKRVVRFQLNRNLGRPIRSIAIEPFPEDGLDAAVATGGLAPNMEVTHRVRVVFDEPPLEATGKPPTSVFLVGKHRDAYRIALVNQVRDDDD